MLIFLYLRLLVRLRCNGEKMNLSLSQQEKRATVTTAETRNVSLALLKMTLHVETLL